MESQVFQMQRLLKKNEIGKKEVATMVLETRKDPNNVLKNQDGKIKQK